jgi:hypothetical protein
LKDTAVLLIVVVLVAVVLGALIISAALVLPRLPIDDVKCFNWTDVGHGAVVYISLTTDALWVTNYSRKITFFFAVQNISGCPNATIFYDNSYVILNGVKLDPSYLNLGESPFKKLLEKQAWSVDWYFTPKADDFVFACMGISKGKHIQYPMFLEVNYTVVDSEGIEWLGLFQNSATVTIVGGDDAP